MTSQNVVLAKWPARKVTWITFSVIFVFMGSLYFLEPEFAFGRSVGFMGCLIIFGLLAAGVGLSASVWYLILPGDRWSRPKSVVFAALVLVSSFVSHDVLAYLAHTNLAVGDYLMQAKIEYFCLDAYSPGECISHFDLCPRCAKKIARWDVTQMSDRLKTARQALQKKDSEKN